ncbi:hypothetical protein PR003_g26216 [Phytophthora rubi]|uniref:DDE Tnp4 domain-containing protein n=2 Tax=Phytophthora TaxID=4783 RepID=A0A6A3ICW2_9STRA|nr:hypothetical protein PF011_g25953 [Phytophthora fragariae]KAE8977904.1 hypothetical protein PR001_g24999 [Phytophthora rubi]KAE9286823.1 hypothetical protein PR003_g26216 [Phytophthora rubi]
MSRTLCQAEVALAASLREIPLAAVQWPSSQLQATWASQVTKREGLLKGCFCVADGKNYAVQAPTNSDVQNAHYNGEIYSFLYIYYEH